VPQRAGNAVKAGDTAAPNSPPSRRTHSRRRGTQVRTSSGRYSADSPTTRDRAEKGGTSRPIGSLWDGSFVTVVDRRESTHGSCYTSSPGSVSGLDDGDGRPRRFPRRPGPRRSLTPLTSPPARRWLDCPRDAGSHRAGAVRLTQHPPSFKGRPQHSIPTSTVSVPPDALPLRGFRLCK
jgi:hypothetical protein